MKSRDFMTTEIETVTADQTAKEAAGFMLRADTGSIPVCDEGKVIGMITDRDIAVRAVAHGKSPDTRIREVMTDDVKYCFDDDDVEDVARNMADIQVRRLPVVNRDKRLVGIVAIADIAASEEPEVVGEAVSGISEAAGER